MYQDYQNDQFQDEEIGQKINQSFRKEKEKISYEQKMNDYVKKESILPKILPRQKSAKQYHPIKSIKEKKKVESSVRAEESDSLPKKSFSQYSVFKKKSRHSRFQQLDVNRSKTIQKQQKSLIKNTKKKSSLIQSVNLKNQASFKRNQMNIRTSNQINRKLTLNTTNQSEVEKIQHYFSHSKADLQKMSQDELNRVNNRLHQWIEKFNRRLDEILGTWVRQQSIKKGNKQSNTEKVVELLEKHITNNKDLLVRIDQESKKLQDKTGQMKEQQYQFLLYKQIDRITTKIKEEAKNIISLKKKNQLSGTKIVSQQDSKVYQQKINQIKLQLLKFRKQEDSNIVLLQQLDRKYLKTKDNFQKSEQLLRNVLKQAEQKQIVINQTKLDIKWSQMKMKIQKIKTANSTNLASNERTIRKITQQNKLLRNQIKQYEEDIEEINSKINVIREKSQFIIEEKQDSIHSSKLNNSNSILFFSKNKKEPQAKIAPFPHNLKIKESQNKASSKQKNDSILHEQKTLKAGNKPQIKRQNEVVKQEKESESQYQQEELAQNQPQESVIKVQQQDINEFIDLNAAKINDYLIQQRQKISISPQNKNQTEKTKQNGTESLSTHQQKNKKSNRRFLLKKRNNQEQR